jgi:hypothetical protein
MAFVQRDQMEMLDDEKPIIVWSLCRQEESCSN